MSVMIENGSCLEQNADCALQFDRRVVPIVCTLYVLSYVDRGNIGNAKSAGADDDLGLDDGEWTWVLNAFYICYVLFEWASQRSLAGSS